jgi:hypothetical protein
VLESVAVRPDQPDMAVEARAFTFGVGAAPGLLVISLAVQLTGSHQEAISAEVDREGTVMLRAVGTTINRCTRCSPVNPDTQGP